jgi:hypothetical protein
MMAAGTAGRDHYSRPFDVERTALEIRRTWVVSRCRSDGATYGWKFIAHVLASDLLTPLDKCVAIVAYTFADVSTGANSRPSQRTVSAILGCTERAVRKAQEKLRRAKFMERVEKSTQHRPPVFNLIAQDRLDRTTEELAQKLGMGVETEEPEGHICSALENPDLHICSGLNEPERNKTTCQSGTKRPPTYNHIPIEDEDVVPRVRGGEERTTTFASFIGETERERFNRLLNDWGEDGRALLKVERGRGETDRQLDAEVQVHARKGEDIGIIAEAVACALNAMEARIATETHGGWTSALGYFRKALRGQIDELRLSAARMAMRAKEERAFSEARIQRASDGGGRRRNASYCDVWDDVIEVAP